MVTSIVGLGVCAPNFKLTQEEAFASAQHYCGGSDRQKRALRHLYSRSMIETRGVVLDKNSNKLFSNVVDDELSVVHSKCNASRNNLSGAARELSSDLSTASGLSKEFFPVPQSIEDLGPTTGERMSRYEREVASIALKACENAFEDVRRVGSSDVRRAFKPSDIAAIVTVSCTGFYSPGLDIEIIDKLGLKRSVSRTNIGFMGCHGAMNGLRVADALAKASGSDGYVLLCAAEICSIHFHYGWNSDNLLANSLFSDGAAAMILAPSASDENWCVQNSASYVVPHSLDAMSWKIENNGFSMTLSPAVPALIQNNLRVWVETWLSSMGLEMSDIQAWAVHPGGAKIVEAVGHSLELPDSALSYSLGVLKELGNMSSPTVLFILEKIRASVGCVPTVVLAFGPGLTIEAAYLSSAKK